MNSDPSGCLKIARDRLANWLDFFLGFLPLAGAFKPVESIVKKAIEHYGKSKLKDYLKKIFKKVISKSIINLFKGIIKLIKKKTIITAFMMVFIPKIGKTVAKLFLEDIKSLNATIIVNLLSKIGNMCIENIDIFFSAGSFIAGFFDYYSDKKLNGYITI